MQFASLAAIAGITGLAYAQSGLGGVPSCAQPCLTPYISGANIAGCNSLDITCICSNSNFITGIESCVCQKCSVSEQDATIKYALGLCSANQVTNLPTAVTCPATVSSTGSTSATSGGTTAAPATTTSAASTKTSGASVASTKSPAAAPRNMNGIGAGVLGALGAAAVLL